MRGANAARLSFPTAFALPGDTGVTVEDAAACQSPAGSIEQRWF
jgi:hypothetical protein